MDSDGSNLNQMPIPEAITVAKGLEQLMVRLGSCADHGVETISLEPHGLRVGEKWSSEGNEGAVPEMGVFFCRIFFPGII